MFDHEAACQVLRTQPASLADDDLTAHMLAAIVLAERAEAAALAAVAEWDSRTLWAVDGAVNPGQWLASRTQLAGRDARGLAHSARALQRTTEVARALAEGDLPVGKAKALAAVRTSRTAELFDAHEHHLVEAARTLSVDDTIRLAQRWLLQADSDGPKPDDDDQSARMSPTYEGRWRLEANLNAEGGPLVRRVLEQIMAEQYKARTADGLPIPSVARRRADALVEMARRASAAREDQPAARPLIVVRTELSDLLERSGASAATEDGIPVSWDTLRRLLCDADVCRVVMDGPSQVIDVGRDVRTATAAQRRALLIRDHGCVFPGCDRPPGWCEAHHIRWWEDLGPTDLSNLCLLCSRHHHLIHQKLFSVHRSPEGDLVFTRPDGFVVEVPAAFAVA
jgi:hypothetical protein